MQRLKSLLRSVLKFGKSKISARLDTICAGLEEQDGLRVFINVVTLVLTLGLGLCVCIIFLKFIVHNLHIFIVAVFVAAALYSAVLKFLGVDISPCGSSCGSTHLTHFLTRIILRGKRTKTLEIKRFREFFGAAIQI